MAKIRLFLIQRSMKNVVGHIAKVFGSIFKADRINLIFDLEENRKNKYYINKKTKNI